MLAQRKALAQRKTAIPPGDGRLALRDGGYGAAFLAMAFCASTLWALFSRAWASGRKVSAF
jgi:hypothetical protein